MRHERTLGPNAAMYKYRVPRLVAQWQSALPTLQKALDNRAQSRCSVKGQDRTMAAAAHSGTFCRPGESARGQDGRLLSPPDHLVTERRSCTARLPRYCAVASASRSYWMVPVLGPVSLARNEGAARSSSAAPKAWSRARLRVLDAGQARGAGDAFHPRHAPG